MLLKKKRKASSRKITINIIEFVEAHEVIFGSFPAALLIHADSIVALRGIELTDSWELAIVHLIIVQ
jgi:hypothetical protein